jgi:hypothetical protein
MPEADRDPELDQPGNQQKEWEQNECELDDCLPRLAIS